MARNNGMSIEAYRKRTGQSSYPKQYKNYAVRTGANAGKRVAISPYGNLKKIRSEVGSEFTPYYKEQNAIQQRYQYDEPLTDVKTNQSRLLQEIAAGREQRDITEGQELQGYNQGLGNSGTATSSPTAARLLDRVQRVQAARTEAQERGYTQAGQDLTTSRSRLLDRRGTFQNERAEALKQLIAQEVQNRAYQQY